MGESATALLGSSVQAIRPNHIPLVQCFTTEPEKPAMDELAVIAIEAQSYSTQTTHSVCKFDGVDISGNLTSPVPDITFTQYIKNYVKTMLNVHFQ